MTNLRDISITMTVLVTELHSRVSAGYLCQNHVPRTEIVLIASSHVAKNVLQKCPISHNVVLDVVLSEGGELSLHCCICSKNNEYFYFNFWYSTISYLKTFLQHLSCKLEKHIQMSNKGSFKCYVTQMGWRGCPIFRGKARYEGVRFHVISVTRSKFQEKSISQHLNGP